MTGCYLVLHAGKVLPMSAFISDVDAEPFSSDSLSHFLNSIQTLCHNHPLCHTPCTINERLAECLSHQTHYQPCHIHNSSVASAAWLFNYAYFTWKLDWSVCK